MTQLVGEGRKPDWQKFIAKLAENKWKQKSKSKKHKLLPGMTMWMQEQLTRIGGRRGKLR
jgi:hypothetical protein